MVDFLRTFKDFVLMIIERAVLKDTKDEKGNQYVFQRVTESKSSGGKKNRELKSNPIKGKPEKYFTKPLKNWSLSKEDEKIIDELVRQKFKKTP